VHVLRSRCRLILLLLLLLLLLPELGSLTAAKWHCTLRSKTHVPHQHLMLCVLLLLLLLAQ
jgi:hypothetical protein